MHRILFALFALSVAGSLSASAAETSSNRELLFADPLNGRAFGNTAEIRFVPNGKELVAALTTPNSTIQYPAGCFYNKAGRIELDVQLTQDLTADHKFWTLLSDVGAGGSHPGAINIHWREKSQNLEFMMFDGKEFHTCTSKIKWVKGKWYRLAFTYGVGGMSLEVNGKVEDKNDYAAPLSETPKKLGFKDDYVEAPPVLVSNFKTYRHHVNALSLNPPMITPNGDGLVDTTDVQFSLATDSKVTIEVVDDSGKVVKRLANEPMKRGEHSIPWDGQGAKQGNYTVKLAVGNQTKLSAPLKVDLRYKWSKVKPLLNDTFPIGVWFFWESDASYIKQHVDDIEKAKSYYESSFKQLSDLGINLIVANWTPHDHRQLVLDTAQKYGIRVILHLDEVNDFIAKDKIENGYKLFDIAEKAIAPYKDHPAVIGYYIIDEPWNTPDQTERIAFGKKVLEALDPKHSSFSCLLSAYEETLKAVDYQALIVDIYPIREGWKGGDLSSFASEAERARKNAGTRPLWVIPQAFGTRGGWQFPTETELETELWLSLAAGARGIIYFIYQSTTSIQGEWIDGWVDMDMKPKGDRLQTIARMNELLKKAAPLMLKLKADESYKPTLPAGVYGNAFKDTSGNTYLIVANKSTTTAVSFSLSDTGTDYITGEKIVTTVELGPGKGRIIKVSPR